MKKLTLIAAAALMTATASLPVLAASKVDSAKEKTLQTQLVAQGYEVRRLDMEDGYIEVYALKDGKRMEMYFDAKTLKQVDRKGDSN
ncbi:PepSY domain-containing protein [Thioclava sp.]|uniref:PepSY domain-containing protein n=1 Tax=Thioclava sp. TaxID=1933450 RepID=UPI003AA8A823